MDWLGGAGGPFIQTREIPGVTLKSVKRQPLLDLNVGDEFLYQVAI